MYMYYYAKQYAVNFMSMLMREYEGTSHVVNHCDPAEHPDADDVTKVHDLEEFAKAPLREEHLAELRVVVKDLLPEA